MKMRNIKAWLILLAILAGNPCSAQTFLRLFCSAYAGVRDDCSYSPDYDYNDFRTVYGAQQMNFLASSSSYFPTIGEYATQDVNGQAKVNYGSISVAGAMAGQADYNQLVWPYADYQASVGYNDILLVSSNTLSLHSPVDFKLTLRLTHSASQSESGLNPGSTLYLNSETLTQINIFGYGSAPFDFTQLTISADDFSDPRLAYDSDGLLSFEKDYVIHSAVGDSITLSHLLRSSAGANYSGATTPTSRNFYARDMADTTEMRITPIYSSSKNSAAANSVDGDFFLVAQSGFDYTSPFSSAVPEPSQSMLLALGLAFTAAFRRKFKNPKSKA